MNFNSKRLSRQFVVYSLLCQPALAAPVELALADSLALALASHANIKVAKANREKAYYYFYVLNGIIA